jgi:hypothetical protein
MSTNKLTDTSHENKYEREDKHDKIRSNLLTKKTIIVRDSSITEYLQTK